MGYIALISFLTLMSFTGMVYASYNGEMTIHNINGDITIQSESDGQFILDDTTYPIFKGDNIFTKVGSAEVRTISGVTIKIGDNSHMEVVDYSLDRVVIMINYGRFFINCNTNTRLEIIIPNNRIIRCNTNARFYLKQERHDTLRISIHYGELTVDTHNKTLTLKAGEDYLFDLRNIKVGSESNTTQWHLSQTNQYLSEAYLPKELVVYASSFDRYGKWVYVSDFGHCWVPTVINIKVWSPFSCGRYIRRHGEKIWITCEPWGWVPHHYGRWIRHSLHGWVWVPPVSEKVVWNPASIDVLRHRVIIRQPNAPRNLHFERHPIKDRGQDVSYESISAHRRLYHDVRGAMQGSNRHQHVGNQPSWLYKPRF